MNLVTQKLVVQSFLLTQSKESHPVSCGLSPSLPPPPPSISFILPGFFGHHIAFLCSPEGRVAWRSLEPQVKPHPALSPNLGWRELSRKILPKLGRASPFRECGELDRFLHPAVAMAQAVEEDSRRSSVLM